MEFRTQADIDKMEKIQNDYMIYLQASGIQLRLVFKLEISFENVIFHEIHCLGGILFILQY